MRTPSPGNPQALRIDTLLTDDELAALEPEWRRLESRMLPLPFVCFDWVIAWWRHFRSRGRLVRDDLFVCTFRTPSGELLGVAPLMITQRPSVGPLRFRQLQFFGADPNITELRCIAASAPDSGMLYAALLDHLRHFQGWWNAATLTGLPSHNHLVEEGIATFASPVWGADTVNPVLELEPSWEAFKSRLPRNIKESLRKCANAPKREGLEFEFRVLSEPKDVARGVGRFFELHHARSQLRDTVPHGDTFASASSREFLLDVGRRFADQGTLRIFQLQHDGAVIATRIGFVRGDSLYLYFSGFDPAYRRYSVMTTVVAEAIKYAIAKGFRTLNLSTGRDVSKTRWAPVEVAYGNVELASPTAIGRLKYRSYRAVVRAVHERAPSGWVSRTFSRGR